MNPESHDSLAAVVLAAGHGTRMKSDTPKVLHRVGGVPMVHRPVALALALGASPVVVVVRPDGIQVQESLRKGFGTEVAFAYQPEAKGTGDAVARALPHLGEAHGTVLILYGDVPNLDRASVDQLLAARRRAAVAFLSFEPQDPGSYGRVVRDAGGAVVDIVEAKDADEATLGIRECNSGIYAVDRALLPRLLEGMDTSNAQGELYLTHMIPRARSLGLEVEALVVPPEVVAGVNDRADLARAEGVWRVRRNQELMRQGVTMEAPDTVMVHDTVALGRDVSLAPGVRIMGDSRLGDRIEVGVGCVLTDVDVAEDVRILPYCVLEGASIGRGTVLGPFARVRPGTVLGEEVKIGNFVEIKKVSMGAGSKASHLTYLGDATIGQRVNVGCGTITCNYDGFRKYHTTVGDDCLIGSDTALVAPVTLGDRVVTGAGSVITNDVPDGALAVSRSRQRNVEGYYERLVAKYYRSEG